MHDPVDCGVSFVRFMIFHAVEIPKIDCASGCPYDHGDVMNDHGGNAEQKISATVPDWRREKARRFWDPSRKLLLAIRRYQYWRNRSGPLASIIMKFVTLRYHFWTVVTGADIPLVCDIGGGLLIPHPNGIVIHPEATIGVNCLIFHQVTIGMRGRPGVPSIEGHVDIGAGAKILGPVCIGSHAKVGANAVVLTDVPTRALAIGVPAKIFHEH